MCVCMCVMCERPRYVISRDSRQQIAKQGRSGKRASSSRNRSEEFVNAGRCVIKELQHQLRLGTGMVTTGAGESAYGRVCLKLCLGEEGGPPFTVAVGG